MPTVLALPLVLLLFAGCAGEPTPMPASPAEASGLAEVDWSQAERLQVSLSDFAFTPERLLFERGRPYLLHLENRGSGGHNFAAPEFFRLVALRDDGPATATPADGVLELAKGEATDTYLVPLAAGRFPLECTHFLHPLFGMTGEIIVR